MEYPIPSEVVGMVEGESKRLLVYGEPDEGTDELWEISGEKCLGVFRNRFLFLSGGLGGWRGNFIKFERGNSHRILIRVGL